MDFFDFPNYWPPHQALTSSSKRRAAKSEDGRQGPIGVTFASLRPPAASFGIASWLFELGGVVALSLSVLDHWFRLSSVQ